jgi:catechol 2,3-dioxygenase-like lactoylglutathione lyase family enzyme
MTFSLHHIHIKSNDPRATVDWWVKAFGLKVLGDEVRIYGDRFIRCTTVDGKTALTISGPRTGETLGPGDAKPHLGLEHIGLASSDIEADLKHLTSLGAVLQEGPMTTPAGLTVAFLACPGDVRVELVAAAK